MSGDPTKVPLIEEGGTFICIFFQYIFIISTVCLRFYFFFSSQALYRSILFSFCVLLYVLR